MQSFIRKEVAKKKNAGNGNFPRDTSLFLLQPKQKQKEHKSKSVLWLSIIGFKE